MELLDGPAEHAADDAIPTLDQAEPSASYKDWNPQDTRIITCRIANDVYPGERFSSRDAALKAITERHGRVIEANYVPGRAFFRVKR